MRTIEKNNFTLVETFIESASAKKSGKRPVFDSMLTLCKKGKIDYIIVDEASRLSRNSTDSARILGLLEEKQIE
jgi:DNA invertase Pin-like site-specific DNA recombinase